MIRFVLTVGASWIQTLFNLFSIAMFVFAFGKYRFNSIPHHDDIVVYFRVQVYDKSKFL